VRSGVYPGMSLLAQLAGIGTGSAWTLVRELFGWQQFHNRRELASGTSEVEQGISKAGRLLRFDELERHTIRFADRSVACPIDDAARVRRRKRPDAVRIVPGISGVRVNFTTSGQCEASRFPMFDHVVLRYVTGVDHLRQSCARPRAMLLDTQYSAGLERAIKGPEIRVEMTVFHPVVDIAKREHTIKLTIRVETRELPGAQRADHDIAVTSRLPRQLAQICRIRWAVLIRQLGRRTDVLRFVEMPMAVQIRSENVRVPTTARRDLQDRLR
jgi:hypothetical protein